MVSSEAPSAISMLYPGILTVTAVRAVVGTRTVLLAGCSWQGAGLPAGSSGTTSCFCPDAAACVFGISQAFFLKSETLSFFVTRHHLLVVILEWMAVVECL